MGLCRTAGPSMGFIAQAGGQCIKRRFSAKHTHRKGLSEWGSMTASTKFVLR